VNRPHPRVALGNLREWPPRNRGRPGERSQPAKEVSGNNRWQNDCSGPQQLAGSLHLIDFPDWDPWEPRNIQYRNDTEVEWLMHTGASERRIVRTVAELDAALEESASPRGIYL
jgi:hypothetical protein